MKLYFHPISGHAHRARLFLALIGADVDIVEVNLAKGEHKSPEYLQLDRFGQVPLLEDDGVIVADSNAIMIYAAKKFGRTDWLPEDARGAARVQRWLSVAAGLIAFGPFTATSHARPRAMLIFQHMATSTLGFAESRRCPDLSSSAKPRSAWTRDCRGRGAIRCPDR